MEMPFVFGKIATNDNFTDRIREKSILVQNFKGMTNSIVISPRRWGKTSLVSSALNEIAKDSRYLTVHLDIFNCRTEDEFFQNYANSILHASSSRLDDFIDAAKKFLGTLGPRITMKDNGAGYDLSFGIEFNETKYSFDDILDLPEVIARSKKRKFVVCIDEFQNVAGYEDGIALQQKLRSHWQQHSNVCYCLYGSKRHMLMDIFGNSEMPFYKFGDMMFLEKISENEWIPFLIERFSSHGKEITRDVASLIPRLVDCHPYYVQQLAQQSWLRCEKECTEADVREAHLSLVSQMNLLFCNIIDSLSARQVNFLNAVADGETSFSSKKVLEKYKLGTSANIKNLKKALLDRDLVDLLPGNKLELQDPLLKFWLKNMV